MMRSLFAGVSGLKNHQTRMDVIGNNIANVNTVGFKSSRVTFQDIFSQTLQGASSPTANNGGTNSIQIGMGTGLASVDTIFTNGSYETTGKQTDMAISGSGFFVLVNGDSKIYTRAGAFEFDAEGNYTLPGTGYKVMGWVADSQGVINTNQGPTGIQIPVGSTMPPQVSTTATYKGTLSASKVAAGSEADQLAAAEAKTKIDSANNAVNELLKAIATAKEAAKAFSNDPTDSTGLGANADKAINDVTAKLKATVAAAQAAVDVAPTGTQTETDFTALLDYSKNVSTTIATLGTAVKNLISSNIDNNITDLVDATTGVDTAATALNNAAVKAVTTADKAVEVANGTSSQATVTVNLYDVQGNLYKLSGTFEKIADNTWTFTPSDTVKNDSGITVASISGVASTLVFNPDGSLNKAQSTINAITLDPANGPYSGAGKFTITPDFSTMTQYGAKESAVDVAADGYKAGTLTGVVIDSNGIIQGKFSNGKLKNLGQVAMAAFNNPAGLTKVGESMYESSSNSGEAQIGTAGTGGRGSFQGATLEMSNVDLAQEFSNMIITQRGFQANSKIITASDEMLQELANLKR